MASFEVWMKEGKKIIENYGSSPIYRNRRVMVPGPDGMIVYKMSKKKDAEFPTLSVGCIEGIKAENPKHGRAVSALQAFSKVADLYPENAYEIPLLGNRTLCLMYREKGMSDLKLRARRRSLYER